jgi:hypothetical protein
VFTESNKLTPRARLIIINYFGSFQTLTDPEYLKILEGALQTFTTHEDFHVFPAEFVTIIDK